MMKGFSVSIRMVMTASVTLVLAAVILGVGFTGTAGSIFTDGVEDTRSSGCDYQRNQFYQGNADLENLNEQCVSEEEGIDVDMRELQENVEIIRCMNDYIETNGNSQGVVNHCTE